MSNHPTANQTPLITLKIRPSNEAGRNRYCVIGGQICFRIKSCKTHASSEEAGYWVCGRMRSDNCFVTWSCCIWFPVWRQCLFSKNLLLYSRKDKAQFFSYIYIVIYIYMKSIFSSQLQNKLFCRHLHLR